MSLMLVFSLAACGNQQQAQDTTTKPTASEPSNIEIKSTGGKILVVYYSATGSTKSVAEITKEVYNE